MSRVPSSIIAIGDVHVPRQKVTDLASAGPYDFASRPNDTSINHHARAHPPVVSTGGFGRGDTIFAFALDIRTR